MATTKLSHAHLFAFCIVILAAFMLAGSLIPQVSSASAPLIDGTEPLPPGTSIETLLVNMTLPIAMVFDPQGRLFYTEKVSGRVRLFENGVLQATPVITFSVTGSGEQGLLGITIDPNFNANRYLYVFYTCNCTPLENRVVRFEENNGVGSNPTTIFTSPNGTNASNHNGGNIHFDPNGKLYISLGDDGDNPGNSQDVTVKQGKIHRINSDGTIPGDNPVFTQTGALPSLYAMGLRNSFDFTVDPLTPQSGPFYRIFASENGPGCDDEMNRIEAGYNYGWRSGYPCDDQNPSPTYNTIPPLWYLGTGGGGGCCLAPTGIEVYTGTQIVEWQGDIFMASYNNQSLRHMYLNPDRTVLTATNVVQGVSVGVDLETGPDGALWYIEGGGYIAGTLKRIVGPGTTATPTVTGTSTRTPTGTVPTATRTLTRTTTPTLTPTPCGAGASYSIATAAGTIVAGTKNIGSVCDDCVVNVALPFPFQLYDQSFIQVDLDSNGKAHFPTGASVFTNTCLPQSGATYTIFPYWDDQRTDIGTGVGIFTSVSGVAPNRIFNIEWRTTYFTGAGTANYEVRLYEGLPGGNSRFDIIYGVVSQGITPATGGVQKNGTTFTQSFCNGVGTPITPNNLHSYSAPVSCGPTFTPTATPTACVQTLNGHLTYQGMPQPNAGNAQPISLQLQPTGGGVVSTFNTNADQNANFTVNLGALPAGTYNWRLKSPRYLASTGSLTIPPGCAPFSHEFGVQRAGDIDNSNCVDITDFSLLRSTFGLVCGNPGYNPNAEYNGDCLVDITDFGLLRSNFGTCGPAELTRPGGAKARP